MHSASSRFNSITLYAGLIMAMMCMINYMHGRIIYTPEAEVRFEITQLPNFIKTNNWEQASFRYNMFASKFNLIQISALFTHGTSNSYLFMLKSSFLTQLQT